VERIEMKEGKEQLRLDLKGNTFVHVRDAAGNRVATLRGDSPTVAVNLPPGQYFVETDGTVNQVHQEAAAHPELIHIALTCDAKDRHPVDGIPTLPADGTSFCTITLQKVDTGGQARKAKEDNETVYLRATGGILKDADGKAAIRQITLVNGTAQFRLVSEPYRRVVTVEALATQLGLLGDRVTVEFV
jgi:hypothetical protein